MSLRAQAEADLAVTLEALTDFGEPFTLTDPSGFASATQLYGAVGDIGMLLDPDTGQAMSGRHATLTARISTLTAAGYTTLPEGKADAATKPWLADFAGVSTASQRYKVAQSFPDRTLGVVTMILVFSSTRPSLSLTVWRPSGVRSLSWYL